MHEKPRSILDEARYRYKKFGKANMIEYLMSIYPNNIEKLMIMRNRVLEDK